MFLVLSNPEQAGGMQDPNADFVEIFETLESLPSAPKKLLDGFGRWLRCGWLWWEQRGGCAAGYCNLTNAHALLFAALQRQRRSRLEAVAWKTCFVTRIMWNTFLADATCWKGGADARGGRNARCACLVPMALVAEPHSLFLLFSNRTMMLPQMQQPGANQLPTPPATLKVSCIPSFVTSEDFGRLMRQLEGCVDARVLGRQPGGEQVGYAEFSDKLNASKAKNLYHGWTGWGGRGLAIELTDFSLSQLTQLPVGGQKRMREGEGKSRRVCQSSSLRRPAAADAHTFRHLFAQRLWLPHLFACVPSACADPTACYLLPTDLLQPNGNYKQPRADMPAMVRV